MTTLELIRKLQSEKKTARARFYKDPSNVETYGNRDKKPEEFKDKTFLYIRSVESDTGSRPMPGGTIFWNSCDIELYDSSGTLIPANQMQLNQTYTITVLVHNEGDMTCNSCVVELFICNPSIGFDRTHATQVGIQSHIIMGHNTVTARFLFKPGAGDLGHRCMFARAYSYVSADMPLSADAFNPVADRHIGQQNLSIIDQGNAFEFNVFVPVRLKTQNLTLKLNQNKAPVGNIKLKGFENLVTTNRTISGKRFLFLQNIGTDNKSDKNQSAGITREQKSFLIRLLLFILSMIFRKKYDPSRFEAMKAVGDNTWTKKFSAGLNKMTMQIPFLFLGPGKATQFEIEMTDEAGKSLGGFTLIVKG